MARKQHTSAHTHTSKNSDNSTKAHRALYLVRNASVETEPRCILQGDLLLAAFDWTEGCGWQISYFLHDLPAEVQDEAWRASYFNGDEKPIATSNAAAHPALRLLGERDRMTVWRIARTVLHQLEGTLKRRIEADSRATLPRASARRLGNGGAYV